MFAIKNARIYDFVNYFEDMYILFDDEIREIGKMSDYKPKFYTEIDAHNKLIMPGLINGHSHIYSMFARGMSVPFDPSNFKELLEQLWWKMDRNITNDITYYSGIVSGVEYLKNGVTTVIDHHASGEIIGSLNELKKAVCDDVQLRGVFCFETSDRFNIEDCITENNNFIKENKTNYSKGLFGMHAAFTLSEDSLIKIKKELHNQPIHIHVAESIMDQEYSLEHYNERVIKRLDRHNLISKNSIITHGLYLDKEELEIIKKADAVVALNVTSNMNNAVGLPDYKNLKEHSIKAIIGNDGISQSMALEYQILYYSMHHFSKSPTGFGYDDLQSIIKNTYEYASNILETKLGRIEVGYQADLLVLDYVNPTPLDKDNIFGHLLFGLFNNFKPSDVFVRGKHLLKQQKISKELHSIYLQAVDSAQILWDRIKKEGQL